MWWKVCYYQTPKQRQIAPTPIIDLVRFIKSQPVYISQYHAHTKCKIPKTEVYQAMKATKSIIMATDGGAKTFKVLLGFVLTYLKNKVPISCYKQAAGHDPLSF